MRRLGPQTLRTEARASAIKTPHAEKREIQWERNGRNEWMTGRAGEELPRSLRRRYNWRRWCTSRRDAISFALSRMSEQKAHSTSWTPFAFHSTSFSTFDLPSILASLSSTSSGCYRRYALHSFRQMVRNPKFRRSLKDSKNFNFAGTL